MADKAKSVSSDLFGVSDLSPQPLHTRQKRLGGWRIITVALVSLISILFVSAGAVLGIVYQDLRSDLTTVELSGATEPVLPEIGEMEGGFNVLVVGSDTREGQGDQFGSVDSELNDVNLLINVSQNHDSLTVISLPRDLIVDIPDCKENDGSLSSPSEAQPLNRAMGSGGLACVVSTVENLTGLDIGYAGLITFTGVAQLSTAVGGVEVCVDAPLVDPWSGINLPQAGSHVLEGGQALAFLRTRKGVGDGSDLARISSQQVYMAALVRTLQEDGLLNDLSRLYAIARTASQTMILSTSLASLDVMVAMARTLRGIPGENIIFIRYPVLDADETLFPGKVVPNEPLAGQVLDRLRSGSSFSVTEGSLGPGSTGNELKEEPDSKTQDAPDALEGLVGQTAEQETCASVN